MTHDELRDLIPAYALDALGAEETRDVEAHLPDCPACREDLALLRDAAAALAGGVSAVEPPAALRARVLNAVRPARRDARVPWGWALSLAAAAVIILVLISINTSLERRLEALTANVQAETQVLGLLTTPGVRTVALTGSVPSRVRLVFDPRSGRGALVVAGLREPGPNLVYQLWLVAGKTPVSAGVFRPVSGQPLIVTLRPDLHRFQAVAISVERGPGGAPSPTSAPILVGAIPGSG